MADELALAVERWMIKAENDLVTARRMLSTEPIITDTACFHTQQCVEKCLKAFLVQSGVHVEKTHYLPRLVGLCADIDSEFDSLSHAAHQLTDYAVADRYPDNWREITLAEAEEALALAERVYAFVTGKLGSKSE